MENVDEGVRRAWARVGKAAKVQGQFYWSKLHGDRLLERQYFMMREGRISLHDRIYAEAGRATPTELLQRLMFF